MEQQEQERIEQELKQELDGIEEQKEQQEPVQRFSKHVQKFNEIRDMIQSKLHLDSLKLIALGNLLKGILETTKLRSASDLQVAKMVANWWKDILETDVEKMKCELLSENAKMMICWNNVMESELDKLDKTQTSFSKVPECPCKDKVEELDQVLHSILAMKAKMKMAINLLEETLGEIRSPGSLLELGLERVSVLGMLGEQEQEQEVPTILLQEVQCWPNTRDKLLRHKIELLARVMVTITKIL